MAGSEMDIDTEVQRVLGHLRDLVVDSDVPRRQIDRQLGCNLGYVGQVLSGAIDLKFERLLEILDAIDIPPQRFLARAFPLQRNVRRQTSSSEALREALRLDKESVELYGFGIDAIRELRQRLERCEAALEQAAARRVRSDS